MVVKYLITGHTGFKGAWLSLMLHHLGHEVTGLALEPEPGSLFERAGVAEVLAADLRVDVRDAERVTAAIANERPDVLVHLAAQSLVRESYRDPRRTYETNVMGTYNVLEAVQGLPSLAASLIVTTDKVYRNVNQTAGYRETDALGGVDPYSTSKAAADLVTQSWIAGHPESAPTAIARAGNVVAGGDVCAERLMVDLIAAFSAGAPVRLRYPGAVRPWQHVLDCLNGYLAIVDALLAGRSVGEAFNIGPDPASVVTVGQVADRVAALWGEGSSWERDSGTHPHEAGLLTLDPTKAQLALGWSNRLGLDDTLRWTVEWAKTVRAGAHPRTVALAQVDRFLALGP